MRGRWSTFGTRRQDAAALGSTGRGSGTAASNCHSNIEVDNEDIIARYENDMNRFGLRPSSPNSSGANPATSRPPLPTKRTPTMAKITTATAIPDSTTDSVIPFKTTVNSIQLEEKNRRKSKSLDSQKADQLVLKSLSKSFDSIQKSFDSMLDKYHLKDTLPEEQYEKTSMSALCLGIMHTFECGDHPVFRNCVHNLAAKTTDEAVTKEMIGDTIEASTIENNMHHARLNIPNKQRDVEYKSANATDEKQQHASLTNNSIYERDVHQTQQSNATIQVSRERRNDDPLQSTRDGTDVLLDELRQSPV